jgi:hypothetical protein
MRHSKPVLLCCADEDRAGQLKLVIETRLDVKITIATSLGVVTAVKSNDFHCAILVPANVEVIDFLRAREIPTLEIGKSPSYADRIVSGKYMMDVLEAIRTMCARERGPKKVAA